MKMLLRRHVISLALALAFALLPALRAAHAAGHALHDVTESSALEASCALCGPLHGNPLDEAPPAPSVAAPAASHSDAPRIALGGPSHALDVARARAPPSIG
ncbi:MAG: hypothetical protein FJ091_03155 [Deltaproteobacteria bacterium]|nr:hypothetical protein [Deltaproteobacteria bacterium]